jgi:hypothetical protein
LIVLLLGLLTFGIFLGIGLMVLFRVRGRFAEVGDDEFDFFLLLVAFIININFLVELEEGLFAHTTDINDFLKGLDSVLEDWFDRLHDTESSLHVINLWLHTLDGFHFSCDLNKRLTIVESFKDSGGKCFLDVFDSSSLCNCGVAITLGLSVELKSAHTRQKNS